MKKLFALVTSLFVSLAHSESCLLVEGLQFEKIAYQKLLVIQNGRNLAILELDHGLPNANRYEFRFFTPTICDSSQNNEFMINGVLYKIAYSGISKFK